MPLGIAYSFFCASGGDSYMSQSKELQLRGQTIVPGSYWRLWETGGFSEVPVRELALVLAVEAGNVSFACPASDGNRAGPCFDGHACVCATIVRGASAGRFFPQNLGAS